MSKAMKPTEQNSMLIKNKVVGNYGQKMKPKVPRYSTFSRSIESKTQAGDGLLVKGVPNLMKVNKKKKKMIDMFDIHGDGKPSKEDKEKKRHEQRHKQTVQPIYSYKKRI
jgi:hypothetical protein